MSVEVDVHSTESQNYCLILLHQLATGLVIVNLMTDMARPGRIKFDDEDGLVISVPTILLAVGISFHVLASYFQLFIKFLLTLFIRGRRLLTLSERGI